MAGYAASVNRHRMWDHSLRSRSRSHLHLTGGEDEELVPGHPAGRWESRDSEPGSLAPGHVLNTLMAEDHLTVHEIARRRDVGQGGVRA